MGLAAQAEGWKIRKQIKPRYKYINQQIRKFNTLCYKELAILAIQI